MKERTNQVHLYLIDSVMNKVNDLEAEANNISNKKVTRTDLVTLATKEFINRCEEDTGFLKTILEKYLLA